MLDVKQTIKLWVPILIVIEIFTQSFLAFYINANLLVSNVLIGH